ncbi:MAG: 4Fe-4S binding protein [archaeon]
MIIGVTGGKGGTGKSTIATSLAVELGKRSTVLLVDADVDCPDDHLLLGIERKRYSPVEQRIPEFSEKCTGCGACSPACRRNAIVSIKGMPYLNKEQCNGCGACQIQCPEKAITWTAKQVGWLYLGSRHGIRLLSGELKTNEPASELVVNALNRLIERLRQNYEYVMVDTSAGTHCPIIAALEICDRVLAVTEPTPLGAHDLKLILELLRLMKKRSQVIINRSDMGDASLIIPLMADYKTSVLAEIPYSKKLINDYTNGVPVQNRHIINLAEKL